MLNRLRYEHMHMTAVAEDTGWGKKEKKKVTDWSRKSPRSVVPP